MNRQSFDLSKSNGKALFKQLLDSLVAYNADPDNTDYNDIHIYQEESFLIIEWDRTPYSGDWGGKWHYLEADEIIQKEVSFPDGHYDYVFPEDAEEVFNEWCKNHPEWVKNEHGIWTNTEENRRFYIGHSGKKIAERTVVPGDSTYDELRATINDPATIDFKALVASIRDDVIQRTDYIVISPAVLRSYYRPDEEQLSENNEGVHKLGTIALTYKDRWETEPKENLIHVYVDFDSYEKGDYQISFLTDNHYQIFKIRKE